MIINSKNAPKSKRKKIITEFFIMFFIGGIFLGLLAVLTHELGTKIGSLISILPLASIPILIYLWSTKTKNNAQFFNILVWFAICTVLSGSVVLIWALLFLSDDIGQDPNGFWWALLISLAFNGLFIAFIIFIYIDLSYIPKAIDNQRRLSKYL